MHRITNVDLNSRTGDCSICGSVKVRNGGKSGNGVQVWRCESKQKKVSNRTYKTRLRTRPYRAHVGDVCVLCGFIPEDLCQLDVDHIDQNHSNNDPSNLQTLCANCHRLKTKRERIKK